MSEGILDKLGLDAVKKEVEELTAAIGNTIESIKIYNKGVEDTFKSALEAYKKLKEAGNFI